MSNAVLTGAQAAMSNAVLTGAQAEKITFKVGVLAPDGSTWANQLKLMNEDVKAATQERVSFRFYFNGAQGDEDTVLAKLAVPGDRKQLQGGIFTGKTLGDIHPDVRALEVPFTFKNREEGYAALQKNVKFLEDALLSKDYKALGFYELGNIYLVTNKKAESLEQLKKDIKVWVWPNDPVALNMVESLGLTSSPLSVAEVRGALSANTINAAYSPPMAISALQWQGQIKYLIDEPLSYAVAAFVVDNKVFKKMSLQDQKAVEEICKSTAQKINEQTVIDNNKALESFRSLNQITFLKFPEGDKKSVKKIRDEVLTKLTNQKFFSAHILNSLNLNVKEESPVVAPIALEKSLTTPVKKI